MQVLKKFGFIALLLVLTSVLSISQNKERIEPNSKFNFKKSMVINDDISLLRMITKTEPTAISVKKEEPSMAFSMLDWIKDKYASMINVMPNQISNVMLYRFIDEWYGVKYRMGGTTKKGVDCSAFVQHLYQYLF